MVEKLGFSQTYKNVLKETAKIILLLLDLHSVCCMKVKNKCQNNRWRNASS